MRKQIDGLAAVVQLQFWKDLDEESIFLFCGSRADRINALYWDGTVYVLLYKCLTEKRFQWSRNEVTDDTTHEQLFQSLCDLVPDEIHRGVPP